MPRAALPVLPLLFLAACGGGGSSPAAPSVPTPAPAPTPTPPAGSIVLRTAALRGVNGHSSSGTVEIVRTSGAHSLEFRSDFRIDMGSVDVYLTRGPGGFDNRDQFVAALGSTSGAQSYTLPDDGSAYAYVLLWCRPFRVPIGLGELR